MSGGIDIGTDASVTPDGMEWREWSEECPNCGSGVWVLTRSDNPEGYANDGDEIVCSGLCGVTLWISCDDNGAWIGGDW